VFFIALTLFVVLGPAIILMLSIAGHREVPGFVAFVQPILLIIAISLYTTAVSISNILTRSGGVSASSSRTAGARLDETGEPAPATAQHEPLAIPRRTGGDSL
jgi:hypothetical protein